jgi:hypothetical protein
MIVNYEVGRLMEEAAVAYFRYYPIELRKNVKMSVRITGN